MGLLAGMLIYNGLRKIDIASKGTIWAKVGWSALKWGAILAGGAAGYLIYAKVLDLVLHAGAQWKMGGDLPGYDDNIKNAKWKENIVTVLMEYVDKQPLTDVQKNMAKEGAERIADAYVESVRKRAADVFKVEGSDAEYFGKRGRWADLWGNYTIGDEAKCRTWVRDVSADIGNAGGIAGSGWRVNRHWNTLFAGDYSLGVFFKQNFISLTFDPTGTSTKDPDFVLDPWQRARPDIFLFKEYNRLFPIDTGTTMEVKL